MHPSVQPAQSPHHPSQLSPLPHPSTASPLNHPPAIHARSHSMYLPISYVPYPYPYPVYSSGGACPHPPKSPHPVHHPSASSTIPHLDRVRRNMIVPH